VNFDASDRDARARRRIVAILNTCEHRRGKVIDGNKIRCAACNRVVGIVNTR
jgi:hypothetical protein